jgi:hypothetical protein
MSGFSCDMKFILLISIMMVLPGNAQQSASTWGERSQSNSGASFATLGSAEIRSGSGVTWQAGKGQFGETWKSLVGVEPPRKSTPADEHPIAVKNSSAKNTLQHAVFSSSLSPLSQSVSRKNKSSQSTSKASTQYGKIFQSIK